LRIKNARCTTEKITMPITNPQPMARPQDVVVLLRLSLGREPVTYAQLAAELYLTASEVHASIRRSTAGQLAFKDAQGKPQVIREALRLFLLHGIRHVFPALRGELTRGVPTSHAAAPLKNHLTAGQDPPPVWPFKDGTTRGMCFYPLYPTVPQAALANPALYELLALVDALRGGGPRERALAAPLLNERLSA
jgi:hypothetical protein